MAVATSRRAGQVICSWTYIYAYVDTHAPGGARSDANEAKQPCEYGQSSTRRPRGCLLVPATGSVP